MPIDVTMPKLSDTMEEGKVLRWLKHVGDRVAPGDVIAEVETDKADMELEAYDEGVLTELRVGEGETVPVGGVIAVLAGADDAASPAGTPSEPAQAPPPQPQPERESARPTLVRKAEARPAGDGGGRVAASPLARRIAEESGLDLRRVAGTGPGGRIVQKDVEAAARAPESAPPARPVPAPRSGEPPADRRIDLGKIRRTTARRMADAKREVPHFYASSDVVMDEAMRLREQLMALGGDWGGLTVSHLVLKAVGLALRRVPELNASAEGEQVVLHGAVNVGLATAVADGLVVPVVRDCDTAPLVEIARRARGLVERARAGRFGTDDLSGGTFTLSNLGMFPVSQFAAVVNPPQAAILAVGTVRAVAVVRDGVVAPGRLMTVTLSCDHRIVDGVLAGRFLGALKGLLEAPVALLV
jgi:pyruvate dehydrogenase E2 component (dihydrolipoamide acetyltransferase)